MIGADCIGSGGIELAMTTGLGVLSGVTCGAQGHSDVLSWLQSAASRLPPVTLRRVRVLDTVFYPLADAEEGNR